ncbi:MAG: UDP-N-acetylmuramoyl-L-alanyl-D-glutamate--2,6-diaminopimelate ligase [Candidatus Eremiobacteraeota bacterium]|nr:UDP-N-acetylmuramoyl-L-alanyl-D-glutamate--2,6-diaminopimelate ligase [Candidatus Eremiobacteraeota bacterium]
MASTAPPFLAQEIVRGASALTIDSRAVKEGAIFVAMRGLHTDGHKFIDDAIARGARTIVMEEPRQLPDGVRGIIVGDSARALSELANAFYGEPAATLTLIGVTGTNGKTTTAQMIAAILNAAGRPTGVMGTLGASIGDHRIALQNTTPLAHDLHGTLSDLRDRGASTVVLEVSSHALALDRVAGLRFAVAALTNVTRDHLDFHGTFESYATAKRALFAACDRAVLNIDDECGAAWSETFDPARTMTYSLHGNADLVAENVTVSPRGSSFSVDGRHFEIPLTGRFNVANALAAIAVARALNVDLAAAAEGLRELPRISGRMESLEGASLQVFIDYAHTPDALEAALRSLRELSPKALTVVFGCGGDRDQGKRAEMGAVAARLADRVFVTSDNPRSEAPSDIAREIVRGIGAAKHEVILDRRSAIERAIESAAPGEIVLVAGKGHETYQVLGEDVLPFDDREVAAAALQRIKR